MFLSPRLLQCFTLYVRPGPPGLNSTCPVPLRSPCLRLTNWGPCFSLARQQQACTVCVPSSLQRCVSWEREAVAGVQISTKGWDNQIPTLILFENGKEVRRLCPAPRHGQPKVTLSRVRAPQPAPKRSHQSAFATASTGTRCQAAGMLISGCRRRLCHTSPSQPPPFVHVGSLPHRKRLLPVNHEPMPVRGSGTPRISRSELSIDDRVPTAAC